MIAHTSSRVIAQSIARQTTRQAPFRSYASGAQSGGASNLPLVLGLAGIAGLGGYVYLQRNPGVEASIKEKAKDVQSQIKASDQSPATAGALIKDSWTPFKLEKVDDYNHNTKIYHFTFGEGNEEQSRGGDVANALLVRSPEGDDEVKDDKGKPVIRPYTPISANDQKGGLSLMIKEYKDGKLTPYISSMKPGESTLLFKGPIPKYIYKANTFDRGLCVAGGSGITPMYQMIRHSLNQTEDKTKWTLVFSSVTEADILLRKEWAQLAKQHSDRLQVKYVLDKAPRGWKGETGFVTGDMITKLFPKGDDKVQAFVCGPPPQVKSLAGPRQGELLGAFKDLGYTADEVYKF